MDIVLEKNALLKITQNAQRALSAKSTLPVLNGIFLEAKEGKIRAHSTDLEISIRDETTCSVKQEGKAVVLGNLLVDLLKNLDDGKVNLTFNDREKKLVIKSQSSQFNLNSLPAEDFPGFPEIEKGAEIQIKKNDLYEATNQVANASSRDESRPVLSGVLLELSDGQARVVATDSYRLALKEIKVKQKGLEKNIIIPRRALEEIAKMVGKEGLIKMSYSNNQVAFQWDATVFISRLIGGQYPNYQQLFPKEFTVEATVNREELLQSAKRMALLSPTTPIVLQVNKNKMTASSKSADVGSGQEEIKASGPTKDLEVAFNARYLIDGLAAFKSEEVTLKLIDSFQPGLIRGKEADYSYLIMPVRLS